MRPARFAWLIGAFVAGLDAAAVIGVMTALDALPGRPFAVISELLGFATVLGPTWLGAAVAAVSILAAGVVGAWASRRGEDRLFSGAVIGVVVLLAGYVAWTFAWSVWRTGGSSVGLPVEAALLALEGMVVTGIALFVPAALLWAWVVRTLVYRSAGNIGAST